MEEEGRDAPGVAQGSWDGETYGSSIRLYTLGGGTPVKPDKAALKEAIEAAELALQNATGINGVAAFSKGDGTIFNLSGQRVSKPGKGIYIVNGRKVLY